MSDNGENGNDDDGLYGDDPFFWWYANEIKGFFETVAEHGIDNIYFELRVEEEDEDKAWLDVRIRGTGELVGHYDDSHICPPDCTE